MTRTACSSIRSSQCLLAAAGLAFATAAGTARAQDVVPSDPPGFAPVTLTPNQTIKLSVVCFEHPVGETPPAPCRGELMLHDAAGNLLRRGFYDLAPGASAVLRLTFAPSDPAANPRLGINPCILPGPGGRAIPSVEVVDNETARVVRFANPATARISDLSNGVDASPAQPAAGAPDPPGFGLVSVRTDQIIRMSVACFEHPVGGAPPDPCRGEFMFHDARGELLRGGSYDLQPGQTAFLAFAPPSGGGAAGMGIAPCILPAPGGRAVPGVEVIDRSSGQVALAIGPAVARMSQLQRR